MRFAVWFAWKDVHVLPLFIFVLTGLGRGRRMEQGWIRAAGFAGQYSRVCVHCFYSPSPSKHTTNMKWTHCGDLPGYVVYFFIGKERK